MSDKLAYKPHPDGMKFCIRCDKKRPLTDFGVLKQSWDGINRYCKACMALKCKEERIRRFKRNSKW